MECELPGRSKVAGDDFEDDPFASVDAIATDHASTLSEAACVLHSESTLEGSRVSYSGFSQSEWFFERRLSFGVEEDEVNDLENSYTEGELSQIIDIACVAKEKQAGDQKVSAKVCGKITQEKKKKIERKNKQLKAEKDFQILSRKAQEILPFAFSGSVQNIVKSDGPRSTGGHSRDESGTVELDMVKNPPLSMDAWDIHPIRAILASVGSQMQEPRSQDRRSHAESYFSGRLSGRHLSSASSSAYQSPQSVEDYSRGSSRERKTVPSPQKFSAASSDPGGILKFEAKVKPESPVDSGGKKLVLQGFPIWMPFGSPGGVMEAAPLPLSPADSPISAYIEKFSPSFGRGWQWRYFNLREKDGELVYWEDETLSQAETPRGRIELRTACRIYADSGTSIILNVPHRDYRLRFITPGQKDAWLDVLDVAIYNARIVARKQDQTVLNVNDKGAAVSPGDSSVADGYSVTNGLTSYCKCQSSSASSVSGCMDSNYNTHNASRAKTTDGRQSPTDAIEVVVSTTIGNDSGVCEACGGRLTSCERQPSTPTTVKTEELYDRLLNKRKSSITASVPSWSSFVEDWVFRPLKITTSKSEKNAFGVQELTMKKSFLISKGILKPLKAAWQKTAKKGGIVDMRRYVPNLSSNDSTDRLTQLAELCASSGSSEPVSQAARQWAAFLNICCDDMIPQCLPTRYKAAVALLQLIKGNPPAEEEYLDNVIAGCVKFGRRTDGLSDVEMSECFGLMICSRPVANGKVQHCRESNLNFTSLTSGSTVIEPDNLYLFNCAFNTSSPVEVINIKHCWEIKSVKETSKEFEWSVKEPPNGSTIRFSCTTYRDAYQWRMTQVMAKLAYHSEKERGLVLRHLYSSTPADY